MWWHQLFPHPFPRTCHLEDARLSKVKVIARPTYHSWFFLLDVQRPSFGHEQSHQATYQDIRIVCVCMQPQLNWILPVVHLHMSTFKWQGSIMYNHWFAQSIHNCVGICQLSHLTLRLKTMDHAMRLNLSSKKNSIGTKVAVWCVFLLACVWSKLATAVAPSCIDDNRARLHIFEHFMEHATGKWAPGCKNFSPNVLIVSRYQCDQIKCINACIPCINYDHAQKCDDGLLYGTHLHWSTSQRVHCQLLLHGLLHQKLAVSTAAEHDFDLAECESDLQQFWTCLMRSGCSQWRSIENVCVK